MADTAQSLLLEAKIEAQAKAGWPVDSFSFVSNRTAWMQFVAWRQANPSLVFNSRDEVRPGLYFSRYAQTCTGGVFLRSLDKLDQRRAEMRLYRREKDKSPKGWLGVIIWGAKKRNLPVELDTRELTFFFGKPCFYCGDIPLISHGIDRLDNLGGYVKGNMVACCKNCNLAKHARTVDDFTAWIHRASKHLLNKGG